MSARKPLFDRLPEIYRLRDGEVTPSNQMEAYVGVIDRAFAAIHANINELYHDCFIDSCAEWAIPYLADLLGTSHLAGDPWTLRADVARTVHHRRRKGTLGAVESVVFALSGWAVHAVEMRERLAWYQHLNHQRPDAGGVPPLTRVSSNSAAVRGGTVTLRDPALLSLVHHAFDPFGHVCDVKPPAGGIAGYNLPNLALFLWRLEDYTVPVSDPFFHSVETLSGGGGLATRSVRFDLHPLGEPMALFNTHRFHADDEPPNLTHPDALPAPMPAARLTTGRPAGNPASYVAVTSYASTPPEAPGPEAVGLTLHLPADEFGGVPWTFRGANLCAWEQGIHPPLAANEIAIDPRGRVVFGLAGPGVTARANAVRDGLYVSPTYGFSGPTGAHPLPRDPIPDEWIEPAPPLVRTVNFHTDPNGLTDALADLHVLATPLIVEIHDSMTHDLDLDAVSGCGDELGVRTLRLSRSVWIRAADGQRPVVRLARPLAFRPADVTADEAASVTVRLEGLYVTRGPGFGPSDALIARAALNRLEIEECTLDPGGFVALDGTRTPLREAMRVDNGYGFADASEEAAFDQTPEIVLQRVIAGPLAIDDGYRLFISGSIVDGGGGIAALSPPLALSSASGDPETAWGPELTLGLPDNLALSRRSARIPRELRGGLTCFGRARVERATGSGGVFVHQLAVHDTLDGCLRFCCFSSAGNRLPQNHGCVLRDGGRLRFTAETFGHPGYGQLALACDRRILEQGPGNDEMGAFGYLRNAHRWKNIGIRLREYAPVGVRPLLIAIT